MFGSIIFQQLYNIADSLVAGKFIGENALAAVGNSYEITLIFIAFAFWLQHRLLGHRVPLLWRKGIPRDEDLGLHSPSSALPCCAPC